MKAVSKVKPFLFPLLGLACILFSEHLTTVLPYIMGAAMAVFGILIGSGYFTSEEPAGQRSEDLTYGIVLFILGVAFIVQGQNALGVLGTVWAVIGVRKAAKSLNRAIGKIRAKEHFIAHAAEFLVRIALALVLLFDPFEKFSTHVAILGLELIVIHVRFAKPFFAD